MKIRHVRLKILLKKTGLLRNADFNRNLSGRIVLKYGLNTIRLNSKIIGLSVLSN